METKSHKSQLLLSTVPVLVANINVDIIFNSKIENFSGQFNFDEHVS